MGERGAKGEVEGKEAGLKVFHLCLGGGDKGWIGVGGKARTGERELETSGLIPPLHSYPSKGMMVALLTSPQV